MLNLTGLSRRCRLPGGLLPLFVTLARREVRNVRVTLLDGLAPSATAKGSRVIRWGGSITDAAERFLCLFPPAKGEKIRTMAPDRADWETCNPDEINGRYKPLFAAHAPWKSVPFEPWDRLEMYGMLRQPARPGE